MRVMILCPGCELALPTNGIWMETGRWYESRCWACKTVLFVKVSAEVRTEPQIRVPE